MSDRYGYGPWPDYHQPSRLGRVLCTLLGHRFTDDGDYPFRMYAQRCERCGRMRNRP